MHPLNPGRTDAPIKTLERANSDQSVSSQIASYLPTLFDMSVSSERDFIINLFKEKGTGPGEYYNLPDFINDVLFHDDPDRSDDKVKAFEQLKDEELIVEWNAVIELTKKGFREFSG